MTQEQPPEQDVQRQYVEKLKALNLQATILANTQSIKEITEHTIDTMEKTLGFTFRSFGARAPRPPMI
jgi:hypothetical protein